MNRANMVKFILLLSSGLGLLALLIYSQYSNRENEEFELDNGYVHSDSDEETLANEKEQIDAEEKDEKQDPINSNSQDSNRVDDVDVQEFDFKSHIQQRTGEKAYKTILQSAEQAMHLFAAGEKQEWKGISTSAFLERLQTDEVQLLNYSKVDSLEVFPTKQVNKEDVIIGAIFEANNDLRSYQLIFKEQQGKYLIDDIVLMWGN